MILNTLKRIKRAPVQAIAALLFAAIISIIICSLQASNEAELRNYEEAYQAVPVSVTITGLPQDKYNYPIDFWVSDLFTGKNPVKIIDLSGAKDDNERITLTHKIEPSQVSLAEYVKDVQIKMSQSIAKVNSNSYNRGSFAYLIGMTSLSCDKQLLPEYGCDIKWYEGYDESIFAGEEPVCLIPEDMAKPRYYDNGKGEAVLDFSTRVISITEINGKLVPGVKEAEYQCTLKIVGTYTAGDEKSIYCPFSIIEQVHNGLEQQPIVDSISATIADNKRLEEFREKASFFFTEPSLVPVEIPWKCQVINHYADYDYYYETYRYAVDIADENLFDLSTILEDSIKFNRTVTLLVVILSVVAGFLVGFLMVRRRKREIMLMRTVGESNFRLYVGFILEQMICVLLGIVVGGAYYNWHPIKNLAIFAVVYFIGLTLALAIFMSKKLIQNVKEDE